MEAFRPRRSFTFLLALALPLTFVSAAYHDHSLDEQGAACPDCAPTLCSGMPADDAVSVHGCPARAFSFDNHTPIFQDGPSRPDSSRAPPATI